MVLGILTVCCDVFARQFYPLVGKMSFGALYLASLSTRLVAHAADSYPKLPSSSLHIMKVHTKCFGSPAVALVFESHLQGNPRGFCWQEYPETRTLLCGLPRLC